MDKILQNQYGRIDHTGKKFGRLTALHYSHTSDKRAYWVCRCDCGNTKVVRGKELGNGDVKSCGCLAIETKTTCQLTHGESRGKRTKEYIAWKGLKNRCYNKNNRKYKNYGARGISVCERWRYSYENFLADMGRAPSKDHSVERDNVNGNYEPSNCRWGTIEEQASNKTKTLRMTAFGRTQTLAQWAREYGICYYTLRQRVRIYGWPPEESLVLNPKNNLLKVL